MTVADEGCTDAASVAAGELSGGVTCGEGTAPFVTVVTTVIRVVTDVAERQTAPAVTGEVHRGAGVESFEGETTDSEFKATLNCLHKTSY